MRRIALASTAAAVHFDDDLPMLVEALRARDVDVIVEDWHDRNVDWSGFELVVIRSTWDYTQHVDEFLEWVDLVRSVTTLANPADVVRWSTDKRYLNDLATCGVPVVPTVLVDPSDGERPTIAWDSVAGVDGEIVVKPVISAGARDTARYGPSRRAEAQDHVDDLLGKDRAVLIQPYLEAIDTVGETGMVFVGDQFSHAFRKAALLKPEAALAVDEALFADEDITSAIATVEELAVADLALDAITSCVPGSHRSEVLYARVDVAPGRDGPVLLELELVEPSFFLVTDPGAAATVADAIVDWVR